MKKLKFSITFSILFMMCGLSALASWDKDQKKQLEDADISFEIGDYRSSLAIYEKLFKSDSLDKELNYKMGVCHFNLRRPLVSLPYFLEAQKRGEHEAYLYLGKIYHLQEKFDLAIRTFQQYKNFQQTEAEIIAVVDRHIEQANYAKKLISDPENVDIENMGGALNTEYHEYAPLVYGDENEMFFTSRREGTTGGGKDPLGLYFEDIYKSDREHGSWQKPVKLNEKLNTTTNDAGVGVSPDGQILYLFRTNDDLVSGDLYQSNLGENGWGQPKKLGSQINSKYVESSASISNDERVLYFSSDREGGYGNKDIYRVVKLPTGEWSLPQNLGPTINTPYDEDAPFIHVDNKTLYFSSKGHKNMGGYDIFESTLSDEGLWSEPRNMGYPICSVTNDLYFVMSPDKQNGYYSSSQEGGFGGQDLYVVNFKLFAEVLSVVRGGVFSDGNTSVPIGARITLIEEKTKKIQGVYKSNDLTGRFIMVIIPEEPYTMMIEAEGYHTYSKQITFSSDDLFSSALSEVKLVPLEVVEYE